MWTLKSAAFIRGLRLLVARRLLKEVRYLIFSTALVSLTLFVLVLFLLCLFWVYIFLVKN